MPKNRLWTTSWFVEERCWTFFSTFGELINSQKKMQNIIKNPHGLKTKIRRRKLFSNSKRAINPVFTTRTRIQRCEFWRLQPLYACLARRFEYRKIPNTEYQKYREILSEKYKISIKTPQKRRFDAQNTKIPFKTHVLAQKPVILTPKFPIFETSVGSRITACLTSVPV